MTDPSPLSGRPLARLRPIAPSSTTASISRPERSPSSPTLSRLRPIPRSSRRVLDFDLETVAAGFADPDWVPQTITAYAFAWITPGNQSKVGVYEHEPTNNLKVRACAGQETSRITPAGVTVDTLAVADRENLGARRRFLEPLVEAIRAADVVTGHNIIRFDLPVLNAECMRVGLPQLDPVLAQDTIRLPRSKGFKKGQDVLAGMLGVPAEKLTLNWWEWQQAYADPSHVSIRERVVGDVVQHMMLREAMRERGWLMAPKLWRP